MWLDWLDWLDIASAEASVMFSKMVRHVVRLVRHDVRIDERVVRQWLDI